MSGLITQATDWYQDLGDTSPEHRFGGARFLLASAVEVLRRLAVSLIRRKPVVAWLSSNYRPRMPDLITPTVRMRSSWLEARDEWGGGIHQPGSGLHVADDVETNDGFAAWVERLRRQADESVPAANGLVHATYWWVVEGDTYLGAISLRHRLNEFLLRAGGHIGYGIRPTARRRGLATWAVGAVLAHAWVRGINRVLITCEDNNSASARTIERNGGVLEDVRDTELGRTRRYWIDLR